MQSATVTARLAYSPDLGAGSSFPERHLDDNESPFSGIKPEPYAGDRPVFGSSLAPLPSPAWPIQASPFPHHFHDHHDHSHHGPLIDSNTIPNQFPQPKPTLQVPLPHTEWASFQDQKPPQGNLFWHPAHPEPGPNEDDSDSIQSTNDSPGEFPASVPTLPSSSSSSKKPRRQGSHRVAKPTTAKARAPTPTAALSAAFFRLPPPTPGVYDTPNPLPAAGPAGGAEIEITYRDGSSSSKIDSKRIAHTLSEKARRDKLTVAIREIQKLLPSEGEEGEEGVDVQNNTC